MLDPDPFNVCHSFIGSSVLDPDPFKVCHSFIGSSVLDPDPFNVQYVILLSAAVCLIRIILLDQSFFHRQECTVFDLDPRICNKG